MLSVDFARTRSTCPERLVTIAPDLENGRAKRVCLTKRGRDVSRTLVALSREVEGDFAARLSPGRMAVLHDVLNELADALERD